VTIVALGDARATIDVDTMARAVDNLLRNAVEASSPGGLVRVRIEAHRQDAVLHVEDQGVGVEEGRAVELFEPFFTTKPEGTGLGLAISRAIARAHGGDVVYERVFGTTRFVLTLPVEPASSRSVNPQQEAHV
jgi:signal transduction histidine kinase